MKKSDAQRSILVVDSDQMVITMLRRNLENTALEIQEARTGMECLRRVMSGNVALVIMDTGLPDLDVQGLLCLLKQTAATAPVPVILMADAQQYARQGHSRPDDCIQKPFDMRDLLERVERYIGPAKLPSPAGEAVPGSPGAAR